MIPIYPPTCPAERSWTNRFATTEFISCPNCPLSLQPAQTDNVTHAIGAISQRRMVSTTPASCVETHGSGLQPPTTSAGDRMSQGQIPTLTTPDDYCATPLYERDCDGIRSPIESSEGMTSLLYGPPVCPQYRSSQAATNDNPRTAWLLDMSHRRRGIRCMPMHICIILMDVHTERCLSICWNNLTCVVKDVEDREIRNINKLELTLDNKGNFQCRHPHFEGKPELKVLLLSASQPPRPGWRTRIWFDQRTSVQNQIVFRPPTRPAGSCELTDTSFLP